MDEQNKTLATFTKAITDMVAKNESSYNSTRWGRNRYERVREYTVEEIENIIESGSVEAQIALSRNYFTKGGFYQRLLLHYATLLKYTGLLIPNPNFGKNLSEQYITKKYNGAVTFIDTAKLPKLFTHIAIKALRDGCYYGVIQEVTDKSISILDLPVTDKSISILDLPIFYCRSRFKDKEGNDIIEFNVTYFDTIHDGEYRKKALAAYPKEITNWYKRYKARKVNYPWCYISPSIGICMSLVDDRPIFLNIISAELEYDDARKINKERDLEEIRKIHVDAIVSKTANDNALNSVDKALSNIYAESGSSSQLFGTDSNLSLSTSITNDMALMMILARKLENLITSIINERFGNSNVSFTYKILPISYYNQKDYVETSLKLANSGYSFILPALAMDISQRELSNIKTLENDVLNLKEKLIPLSTAYTETGNVGRPEKDAQDKSAKTIANEKSLDNGGSN